MKELLATKESLQKEKEEREKVATKLGSIESEKSSLEGR